MLNQDFKEFIQSLNDNQVRYLVIGGYAVALHGHPRYTKDLDVWIELTPENAAKMVKALEQFGFSSLGLKAEDFLVPDRRALTNPVSAADRSGTVGWRRPALRKTYQGQAHLRSRGRLVASGPSGSPYPISGST